jgi:hypothetical protein
VSAALLAAGIGSAVLGLFTFIYELNDTAPFAKSMVWSKAVGGLSGKSGWAIIAFFVAWALLHYLWKDKDTDFGRISTISFVLLAIGLIGTFPPFWHLFG